MNDARTLDVENNYLKPVDFQSSRNGRRIKNSMFAMLLLLTSCGNRETLFKEITDFNKSVQVGTEYIAAYYSNINERELDLYLLILELNPNCEVGDYIVYEDCLNLNPDLSSSKPKPSQLEPKPSNKEKNFSPLGKLSIPLESIQARISLLKEIADYSRLLGSVAGDDSTEKFQGNIRTIKSRLNSLNEKFKSLEKKDKADPSDLKNSNNFINPISTIVRILGRISIEEAKWSNIRNSIIEAEKPINNLLTAIAKDLDTYAFPLTEINAIQRYSLLINYYNNKKSQLSQVDRLRLIGRIVESKKNYDITSVRKPSTVPNGILSAHQALVKLAKSDGSISDIAELRSLLEKFKDDVGELKEAVNQLSNSKGGN
jgi:hypothetical protein